MSTSPVGARLLAFGQELERSAAAQIGSGFTGCAAADDLIESSANAFLFGVLFTQGIPAERAWAGPFRLLERLGTLEPRYLAAHPSEVREAVQRPPMLHRFKETLPRWIVGTAKVLVDRYDGDAAHIWPEGGHVFEVTDSLMALPGIGRKKAVMAVEILVRHFGVRLIGRECGQVAYDVQVRRVFMRTGLIDTDNVEAVEAAAREICPEAPGTLDLAAWLIGREWCRPRAPRCDGCRLGEVCARKTHLTPVGVGARFPQRAPDQRASRNNSPDRSFG